MFRCFLVLVTSWFVFAVHVGALVAADFPNELLIRISGHTLQGNRVQPDRNLNEELKLWESALPKLSGDDVAELSPPLAKRILAASIPKLMKAEPSDLLVSWGKVMGPPLLREIASFGTGTEAPVRFDEGAVEQLRQAVIKSSAARSSSAILRNQAEKLEAEFLIKRVAPRVATATTITTDEKRVVCTVGNAGNAVWITVENGGEALNNVVVGVKVGYAHGGSRVYAFFTPQLAAGESLRAKKTLGDDSEFGFAAFEKVAIETCSFWLWSEEITQKSYSFLPVPSEQAIGAFIMAGCASGTSYRTDIEYLETGKPTYELTFTKLQKSKGMHRLTASLVNVDTKKVVNATATVTDKELARIPTPYGTLQMNFRGKSREQFAVVIGTQGTGLTVNGSMFPPRDGPRNFNAKATVDALEADRQKAIESPEGQALILFKRAMSLHGLGQLEEAKQLYRELIEKYPETRDANTARNNLKRLNESKK